MSTSFEAMGLIFIHCSLFFDPFNLSMSDPIAIGLVKFCGDEGSHHYEYEILLKLEFLFRASPCVRNCWYKV